MSSTLDWLTSLLSSSLRQLGEHVHIDQAGPLLARDHDGLAWVIRARGMR
jgi:hypothetical protein